MLDRLTIVLSLLLSTFSVVTGQTVKATTSEDGVKLMLGNRVLLDAGKDGFLSVSQIHYSPDGRHFAVIGCGYECNDNVGFLFNADGSGKRKFTARWDFVLQERIEWSADSRKLFYFRINSSGAEAPASAPAKGWMEVDVSTGRKITAVSRCLKMAASYAVFNIGPDDILNVRASPNLKSSIVGKLARDAKGIKFAGQQQKVGKETWVKIKFETISGWVNQNYLHEEAPPFHHQ